MPPKKKNAKKKGDPAGDKDKESLRLAQVETANLLQYIEIQKRGLLHARHMEHLWRQRCKENQEEFEKEKQKLEDIAKDMARKSSVKSDQKKITIDDLESKIGCLQLENSLLQRQLETMESKHSAAAGENAKQVTELRQRLQCMHSQFASMMSETLGTLKRELLTPYIGDLDLQVEGNGGIQNEKLCKSQDI